MNQQVKTYILLIIEAIFFIGIGWWYYTNIQRKLDISNQNLQASKTKLEQVEMKNGELLSIRDSYILNINELEDNLEISKKEIQELQRKLDSKVAYIAKIESQFRVDTIETVRDSIIYRDNDDVEIRFHYQDDWMKFDGLTKTQNKSTYIYNLSMDTPLKVGITDDYQIFVQTPNPYVTFSSIEGSVIEGSKLHPKPKRWNVGIYGGFGIHYDLPTKTFGYGPQLGVGLEWKFGSK